MRIKKSLATTAIAFTALSGVSMGVATSASAEAPYVSIGTACDGSDNAPMSDAEWNCYKNGFWGGLASALIGNV